MRVHPALNAPSIDILFWINLPREWNLASGLSFRSEVRTSAPVVDKLCVLFMNSVFALLVQSAHAVHVYDDTLVQRVTWLFSSYAYSQSRE